MGMRLRGLILVLCVTTTTIPLTADDWREFRGPTGQGHAPGTNPPIEWSETENIAWKSEVPGRGWSSPVIADGRLWITTSVEDSTGSSLRLLAYDTDTGHQLVDSEVFRIEDSDAPNPKNSLASPTAVIDPNNERVYVHFGAYGTAAVSVDGTILWSTQFSYISQHGNGGSPIIFDDLLVLSIDGYDTAYVVAIDSETGNERWRTSRTEPVSQAYSTPLLIDTGSTTQIISVAAFRTTAHDPLTGEELWSVGYRNGFSNVPRPVFGHGMVYLSTGFQTPSLLAVRVDGSGDVTRSHIEWRLNRGAPLTPSPILVGEELYVVSDFGIATCINALTGDVHWQERVGGNHSASPIFANGHIYFQNEEGITTVIKPGAEFQVLARNQLEGSMLASMAAVGSALYIRTESHLYRIEETP